MASGKSRLLAQPARLEGVADYLSRDSDSISFWLPHVLQFSAVFLSELAETYRFQMGLT